MLTKQPCSLVWTKCCVSLRSLHPCTMCTSKWKLTASNEELEAQKTDHQVYTVLKRDLCIPKHTHNICASLLNTLQNTHWNRKPGLFPFGVCWTGSRSTCKGYSLEPPVIRIRILLFSFQPTDHVWLREWEFCSQEIKQGNNCVLWSKEHPLPHWRRQEQNWVILRNTKDGKHSLGIPGPLLMGAGTSNSKVHWLAGRWVDIVVETINILEPNWSKLGNSSKCLYSEKRGDTTLCVRGSTLWCTLKCLRTTKLSFPRIQS